MAKLTLDDIVDLRAYERERDAFRQEIIRLKRTRRVPVGPVVTVLFENARTIRFQIQEMARAERIMTDEGIATELRIYNPLIPEPGHLAATLFIEVTSEAQLREWLPKLVGIERSLELRLGGGDGEAPAIVRCTVDTGHQRHLTRDKITASVHYVHFAVTSEQMKRFGTGPVVLASTHPAYRHEAPLSPDTCDQLVSDLCHGG